MCVDVSHLHSASAHPEAMPQTDVTNRFDMTDVFLPPTGRLLRASLRASRQGSTWEASRSAPTAPCPLPSSLLNKKRSNRMAQSFQEASYGLVCMSSAPKLSAPPFSSGCFGADATTGAMYIFAFDSCCLKATMACTSSFSTSFS